MGSITYDLGCWYVIERMTDTELIAMLHLQFPSVAATKVIWQQTASSTASLSAYWSYMA